MNPVLADLSEFFSLRMHLLEPCSCRSWIAVAPHPAWLDLGSIGNSVVNNTGLNSIPAVAGLPGGGLQFPNAAATIPSVDTIGVPSECLWLKNMFDPNDEKEPDFDFDIKEDVEAECSKFGKLKHIYVDKDSAGFVLLQFDNTQSAISAQQALHELSFVS